MLTLSEAGGETLATDSSSYFLSQGQGEVAELMYNCTSATRPVGAQTINGHLPPAVTGEVNNV